MIERARLREKVRRIQREGGGNIRVHPNGFIQVDLEPVPGAARRLHVWNPPGYPLPRQKTRNEVHNHVFDMESRVVRGMLWQVLYELRPIEYPTHERYRAVYAKNSDSRLEPTGELGGLVEVHRFRVVSGGSYTQDAFTFHDSQPALSMCVVTVMTKTEIHDGEASVICKIDQPPDNSYDRVAAASSRFLWEAVGRALS